ncbi:MAG: helix-turn-helix domain-containing protein [Candidatus Nanohaloarchaeota archaeon QJJ-9]|nr:helix-turn-helix domain-containing protein [Candidatus Nanohaloarchaeota archaeon QJJ-9]
MAKLVEKKYGKTYSKDVRLSENPEELEGLFNDTRWRILKLLAKRPLYPSRIAEELDMEKQKVYYHVEKLRENNIIEEESREAIGGSVAKFYRPKDYAFAVELPQGKEKVADRSFEGEDKNVKEFLHPFVNNGRIDCKVVVGSPDPHGPHQVRGRDGHLGVNVSALLGNYGSFKESLVDLDVNIANQESYDSNMVLVGGPLTNTITSKFNNRLPARFKKEEFPYHGIVSEKTEEYDEGSIGLIAKTRNPKNTEKFLLVLAGVQKAGSKAAVLAFSQELEKIVEEYRGEDKWSTIVKGKDLDGDGEVDSFDILE